jgi:TetR/AcrR family transcriptional regulator of autoinduction and epiphytic fitness
MGVKADNLAARRESILEAAKAVFFEDGYGQASMDRIAEQAQTTKRTVYAHFPGKAALFEAVVDDACRNVMDRLPTPAEAPADPREGLPLWLSLTSEALGSPGCVKLNRLVASEAERHPRFAARLAAAYDEGEARLAAYLDAAVTAGRLAPHDSGLAARFLSDAVARAACQRDLLAPDSGNAAASRRAATELARLFLAANGRN